MVPQGRFNVDGEVNKDAYLYDQFILGSPRLRNIDPNSPVEAAYVQAQMAFNRKMDFVRLNRKELKNNGIKTYLFNINEEIDGKVIYNEEFVVKYEMDNIFGIYADYWNFE